MSLHSSIKNTPFEVEQTKAGERFNPDTQSLVYV